MPGVQLNSVVQVGVAFLFIFAALNSSSFIVETVINEVAHSGRVDRHDGYVSSSIIYLFFMFGSFIAAPITSIFGAKWAMVYAACTYVIYQSGFLFLNQPFLYASSALMGIGAAVLWTAQGKYMCLNSTEETAGRNSGVFWAISQACLIFGGIFMFAVFYSNDISTNTITITYGCFTALSIAGVAILACLRLPSLPTLSIDVDRNLQTVQILVEHNDSEVTDQTHSDPEDVNTATESTLRQQWKVIEGTLRLARTKRIFFIIFAFSYTGFILSFWSGIYPTCIASTQLLGYNTKRLLALNAITQGIGQAISGFLFGILSSRTKWLGRYRILSLGAIVHVIAFAIIFINFPADAPLKKTDAAGFIRPNIALALLCGFLLGFGDACWNTQIYAHLIANYQLKSTEAFCLFRFFHSLLTAISFYYSRLVSLPVHLIILTVSSIAGVIGFYVADKHLADKPNVTTIYNHED